MAQPRIGQRVVVDVPATTANLGPGFDCLGAALDLNNRFAMRRIEGGGERFELIIEGSEGSHLRGGINSLTFTTEAQNLSVPHYGIKAGLNHSSFNFTQYNYLFLGIVKREDGLAKPSTTYNNGVKAGFFVDLKLSKNWYISPTVSYSQFGVITNQDRTWNDTYPGDTIRTDGFERNTYKMDYVTLDPNFEYRVTDRFSLMVGPSVAYLISNNVVTYVEEEKVVRTADAYNGEIKEVNQKWNDLLEFEKEIIINLTNSQTIHG